MVAAIDDETGATGQLQHSEGATGVRMRQWRSLLGNDLLQGFRFLGRTQLVPVADHNVG